MTWQPIAEGWEVVREVPGLGRVYHCRGIWVAVSSTKQTFTKSGEDYAVELLNKMPPMKPVAAVYQLDLFT